MSDTPPNESGASLKGGLASFLGFIETYRTDLLPGNDILESTIEERSEVKSDPWND